ncbi:hypothetical protein [Thalassospira xiamenensis]|uniref:Uncharacterized protein n=1 Tax=Thalassospira xiamenensis TaxID=220697 RepID=A0A285TRC8_9PROT|nr:hypothetical protein [Thalassospira xiamenensis]SOC26139.1 hypothetical protein SAMN05428964_10563 [Thalassospira xiamenensis]
MTPKLLLDIIRKHGYTNSQIARNFKSLYPDDAGKNNTVISERLRKLVLISESEETEFRHLRVYRQMRYVVNQMRLCERREKQSMARRSRAEKVWWNIGARQPLELSQAAAILDRFGEYDLSDWLLTAKPTTLPRVIQGVAIHSLLRGYDRVWDLLGDAGLIEDGTSDFYVFSSGTFQWAPTNQMLVH